MPEPTDEEAERIARGLTIVDRLTLRYVADKHPAMCDPTLDPREATGRSMAVLVGLGLMIHEEFAGFGIAKITDLGRRVAAALSRTGSEEGRGDYESAAPGEALRKGRES